MLKKVVVIGGPTASGKSDMALYLARRFPIEIVNFDSMQIYRYMDIGTAKPPLETRKSCPHHLYDIRNPDEYFSVADYVNEAEKVIRGIFARGNYPLFVGGTGLYIRSFLRGLDEIPYSNEIRRALLQRAEKKGLMSLYGELEKRDPEFARDISCNDRIRVIRALEVMEITGYRYSLQRKKWKMQQKRFDPLFLILCPERGVLYENINRRVGEMLSAGFVQEVESLLEMGYSPESKALKSLGYRHIVTFLKGKEGMPRTIEKVKRDTRRFAKRQITWFRREEALWFDPNYKQKIGKLVDSFLI